MLSFLSLSKFDGLSLGARSYGTSVCSCSACLRRRSPSDGWWWSSGCSAGRPVFLNWTWATDTTLLIDATLVAACTGTRPTTNDVLRVVAVWSLLSSDCTCD